MGQTLAKLLIANRWWMLLIAAGLLGAAYMPARQLTLDRRIEQMFPTGDPSVESYQLLRRRFGGNAVAMLVYRDPQLLTPEGLSRISKFAEQASDIPGVMGVLTLSQVNDALSRTRPGNFLSGNNSPAILESSRMAFGFRKLFEGYTHDESGQFAAIVTMLDPAAISSHERAIAQLRTIGNRITETLNQSAVDQESVAQAGVVDLVKDPQREDNAQGSLTRSTTEGSTKKQSNRVALVGEPVLITEGFTLIEEDGNRLSTSTILLLGLTTLIMFRGIRWVLAQLVVISWSVTLTKAAAVVFGLSLSMVSSMLTAIVTVIAVACIIHIAVAHGVRRRRGDSPEDATRRTLSRMLPPIIWACVTDAAGFAALMISSVGPVRDFGLMMTLGTGMVLVAILLIMPSIMLFPPQNFRSYSIPGDRLIRRWLVKLVLAAKDYRKLLAVATAVLVIVTGIGLSKLETETNFIKNFRSGSELAEGYAMVETEFGGAGVWDVILPMPQDITRDYLASVRKLEMQLRNIAVAPGKISSKVDDSASDNSGEGLTAKLTKVLSMADADAVAGSEGLLAIAPPTVRIAGMRVAMPTFVDALITPGDEKGQRYLRIMLRSPERLPAETKLALIKRVEDTVQDYTTSETWLNFFKNDQTAATDNADEYQGQVTGYYVLLARLIESLLSDQWLCLSVAAIVIFAVMWIAFRSFLLAVICMVPNLLPVLFVLGVIGLLGIRINMGAAMIAAVSIGLTIDGSIHFLTGYQSSRRRGDSRTKAVLHSQRKVGLPVLLATVALAMGFSVLTTSSFVPTMTFGILVSAALAAGTLANLTLLPLILASRR